MRSRDVNALTSPIANEEREEEMRDTDEEEEEGEESREVGEESGSGA